MVKELVVYFSVYGTARIVAEEIAKQTGADIAEIESAVPYPAGHRHRRPQRLQVPLQGEQQRWDYHQLCREVDGQLKLKNQATFAPALHTAPGDYCIGHGTYIINLAIKQAFSALRFCRVPIILFICKGIPLNNHIKIVVIWEEKNENEKMDASAALSAACPGLCPGNVPRRDNKRSVRRRFVLVL